MKGYLTLSLDDDVLLHAENNLFKFEADRMFYPFVSGSHFGNFIMQLIGCWLYQGDHIIDFATVKSPRVYLDVTPGSSPNSANAPQGGVGLTSFPRRFRWRASRTITAPTAPNQRAFAMSRVGVVAVSLQTPDSNLSTVDLNLRQVGAVFAHPVGRRAFFNEQGQAAQGAGVVSSGGRFMPNAANEAPAYIYDVRVKTSGNATTGEYVFRRRPYHLGAFEPGAGVTDDYVTAAADTLVRRMRDITTGNRGYHGLAELTCQRTSSPAPSEVPYRIGYPTSAISETATNNGGVNGMCFDGLADGRIWWTFVDAELADSANASLVRSLWAWQRFAPTEFERMDTSIPSYPSLATNVQYRDCKAGRNGLVYVSADGSDDAGNGSDNGALIVIDAKTKSIVAVLGASSGGIYTHDGLAANNVLGVTVDKTESVAAAGHDRVWVLSRAGLTWFDVEVATGTVGARTALTGAPIQANSLRGHGPSTPSNSTTRRHVCAALIDHASNGDVYWVSSPSPAGIWRLNRITGDGATHTYLSLDASAEGGAAGYLALGEDATGAVGRQIFALVAHRRDPGDPAPDDVWVSANDCRAAAGYYPVVRIPVTVFSGDVLNDVAVEKWEGSQFQSSATRVAWRLSVAPDGSAYVLTGYSGPGDTRSYAILESLGRVASGAAFDSASSTMTADAGRHYGVNVFVDDTGIAYFFGGKNNVNNSSPTVYAHGLGLYMPIAYQWDAVGERWYRSRFPTLASAVGKTCHTDAQELSDGVTVSFSNGAGGPTIFVADEYYTFGAAIGVIKDATQQLSWSYDIYTERTDLVLDEAPKTASNRIGTGGRVNALRTATPATVDPFASSQAQNIIYQRSLLLNGSNGTVNQAISTGGSGAGTASEIHYGIDLDSDVVTSQLRFCFNSGAEWTDPLIRLYSAKAGDGPTAWTLRAEYQHSQDAPDWVWVADAFGTNSTANITGSNVPISIEIDLSEMASQGRMLNGTDLTQQYWKLVITPLAHSQTLMPAGIVAFDGDGKPHGATTSHYLKDAHESNYLANYVVRATWRQDIGTGSAARGPATNQVTLTGDEFALSVDGIGNGTTDSISAPAANEQTLTVADGAFNAKHIGRNIIIGSAGNGVNNGTFLVTDVLSATQVVYTNAAGVVESGFSGTWEIDGTAANDWFRAKVTGTVDSFTDNVSGIQTLVAATGTFVAEDRGRVITIASATEVANNGTFVITRVIDSTSIQLRNEGGVLEAVTSATWRIIREYRIATADSLTQLTLTSAAQPFSAVDWEVVRNADVRPRDDEGGGEDVAAFPSTPGQIFVCPVTGHIVYHPLDISYGRVLNVDRYIKVKRGL